MRKVIVLLALTALAAAPVLAESVARNGNVAPVYTTYENDLGRGPGLVCSITEGTFTDLGPIFQVALTNAGYTADLIYDPLGVWPPLGGYDVVAVTTNDDWWSTPGFTAADEAILAAYLDTGGLVIFEGQDYLYMRGGFFGFPQTHLGVTGANEDLAYDDVNLQWFGTLGGPLDGQSQAIMACFASNGFFTDQIFPATQGLAEWISDSNPNLVEGGSVVSNAIFSTIAMGCGDLDTVIACDMAYLTGGTPVEDSSWGAIKGIYR
jgi:hypothetical protein